MPFSDGKLNRRVGSLFKPERTLLSCVVRSTFPVILRCASLIVKPYPIDYGEGLIMDGASSIRHAQPLYPNPFGFPVVLHGYGPVAYAVAAATMPGGAPSFPAGRFLIHPDRYSLMQFLVGGALVAASAPVVTALAVWYVAVDLRGRGRSFPAIYLR